MRILLIDLGAAPLAELQAMLPKYGIQLATGLDQAYDGVILAGSYEAAEIDDFQTSNLLRQLDEVSKPIVAIGSGFALACLLSGTNLAEIFEQAAGAAKLVPTDDGSKLFQGTDPLVLRETTRWAVDELPKSLQVLARSESGIEAFRHKQRPLTAIQQLPQDFVYPSDAKLVYANLASAFGKV